VRPPQVDPVSTPSAEGTAATGEWPVAAEPSDEEKEEKEEVFVSLIRLHFQHRI